MKNIIQQLPDNQFIRIHHSYIVNINKVKVFHKEKLEIAELELPVSEKYRNVVKINFGMK
jgi:DNA-binding LytR/AlgR family response regulator